MSYTQIIEKKKRESEITKLIHLLQNIEKQYQNQGFGLVYEEKDEEEEAKMIEELLNSGKSTQEILDHIHRQNHQDMVNAKWENRGYVDNYKVRKLLKKVLTDDIIIKIGTSDNDELIKEYLDVSEFLFNKQEDKDPFVYSRVELLLGNLPYNSKYRDRVKKYAEKQKPTIGSTVSTSLSSSLKSVGNSTVGKTIQKADMYTEGGCSKILFLLLVIMFFFLLAGIMMAIS